MQTHVYICINATWDGSATSSTISHGLWGQTPQKASLKNLKALET